MSDTTGPNKAIAAGLAAFLSTIVVYAINRYSGPPPLPAEMVAAIQGVLTVVVVYLVPHGGSTS